MPQGANQPRVCQIVLNDATGVNGWNFTATAAAEETSQGLSVEVTITQSGFGVTPPERPDTLEISFRIDDSAAIVRTISLNAGNAAQVVTFHFTDTGASGGAARHGTIRLRLRATRTSGTPADNYDVNSDTGSTVLPAGWTISWNKGWIIGTTTKIHSLSNSAPGGGKNQPAEYDESIHLRVSLGSQSYDARTLGVALSAGGISGNTNSTTSATRDASFSNVVDDRFPAAVSTVSATVTAPNATLSAKPYTTFTSTTPDTVDVDPRLNALSHLFQIDDDVIGTPPMSKHDSSKAALATSYSAMAFRIVTARTQSGINGLAYTFSADPRGPGATITRSGATATRGDEAGWTDLNQIGPYVIGGLWDIALDVTSPADIDNNAHLLNSTDLISILSPDPRILIRGEIGGPRGEAWDPGDRVIVKASAGKWSSTYALPILPDSDGAGGHKAYAIITREQDDGGSSGLTEFLQADGVTWSPIDAADDQIYAHQLSRATPTGYTFEKEFTTTSGWEDFRVGMTPVFIIEGTPYAPRSGAVFPIHFHDPEFDSIAAAVPGVSFQ